jgi:hypothetical protein
MSGASQNSMKAALVSSWTPRIRGFDDRHRCRGARAEAGGVRAAGSSNHLFFATVVGSPAGQPAGQPVVAAPAPV